MQTVPSPASNGGRPPLLETRLPHPGETVQLTATMTHLVGLLAELIGIRESFDPTIADWDTASRIRELERELAREWSRSHVRPIGPSR